MAGQSPRDLTIAIPTYQRDRYLSKALSLLRPILDRFANRIELIILDNASEDETPAVVQRFRDSAPSALRLRTVRHPRNIGMADNILRGIDLATSRYFMFIGDDDMLIEESIAEAFKVIDSNVSPSAIIQASWPRYGFGTGEDGLTEPEDCIPLFSLLAIPGQLSRKHLF